MIPQLVFAAWWNPLTWFTSELPATKSEPIQQPKIDQQSEAVDNDPLNLFNDEPPITESKIIEKETIKEVPVEKRVVVNDPDQAQKIKELTAQLDQANKTIASLKSQITYLQTQVNTLSAISKPSPSSVPTTATKAAEPIDYSKYAKVDISSYAKNPLPYLGQPISVKWGSVVCFSPAIDPNTGSSYINIIDYKTGLLQDEVALKVESVEDFNQATHGGYELKIGDLVNIYGIGAKSEEFKIVGGSSGSYTKYKPVIVLQRLLKCPTEGDKCDGAPYFIFSK